MIRYAVLSTTSRQRREYSKPSHVRRYHRFMTRLCSIAIAVIALAACTGNARQDQPDFQVEDVTIIVPTESEILSQPVDLALDDRGNLYVLDRFLAQILVLSPTGELLRTIGREGSGPGEFIRPRVMALSGDTVRVADVGNGRLQTLALDSGYIRSTQLPAGANLGRMAINEAGRLIMGTFGIQDALAAYYDESGDQVGTLGSPFASVSAIMDFTSMKKELIAGQVPAMTRNSVLPVFAPDGGMWLILNGEGLVQRYDNQGSLQMSVPLAASEFELIWAEVVRRNIEILDNQRSLFDLQYVVDAAVVGERLWLLLNMPEKEPAVMLALSADGTIERRALFSRISGARDFAVARSQGRIFFTIPSTASIVAASWPDDAF